MLLRQMRARAARRAAAQQRRKRRGAREQQPWGGSRRARRGRPPWRPSSACARASEQEWGLQDASATRRVTLNLRRRRCGFARHACALYVRARSAPVSAAYAARTRRPPSSPAGARARGRTRSSVDTCAAARECVACAASMPSPLRLVACLRAAYRRRPAAPCYPPPLPGLPPASLRCGAMPPCQRCLPHLPPRTRVVEEVTDGAALLPGCVYQRPYHPLQQRQGADEKVRMRVQR